MVTGRIGSLPHQPSSQRGFTYLWVLFAVGLLGIGLTAASELWVNAARREQREQFDWVGAQFTRAIGSYYHATPGGAKSFPRSFDDLLEDRRAAMPRRHLRALYLNPYTASADWEPLRAADGGLRGVRGVRGVVTIGDAVVTQDFSYVPRTSD